MRDTSTEELSVTGFTPACHCLQVSPWLLSVDISDHVTRRDGAQLAWQPYCTYLCNYKRLLSVLEIPSPYCNRPLSVMCFYCSRYLFKSAVHRPRLQQHRSARVACPLCMSCCNYILAYPCVNNPSCGERHVRASPRCQLLRDQVAFFASIIIEFHLLTLVCNF